MKVLFITNLYPSSQEPNRGVFIQNQVRALKKRGIDVCVLLLDFRSIRHNKSLGLRNEKNESVDVFVFSFPISPLHRLQYLLAGKVTCYAYNKVIKRFGVPDIIHGHFLEGSYGIKDLKRKYGIPCVVTEHGSNVFLFNRTTKDTKRMNKLYQVMDNVIFVGKEQARNATDLSLKNSQIIPNVVPDFFQCIDIENKHKDSFVFVTVANLIPSKRIDLLIRAFALVKKKCNNVKLEIVGTGIMKADLINLVDQLELNGYVEFKGAVKNCELVEIYNSADCFVLPSIYETFGMVYAEALCCGLPIISVDNGGINEIVEDCDYAKIIPVDNMELLASTMENFLQSSFDRYMISAKYINKFSEAKFFSSIMSVYNKILHE